MIQVVFTSIVAHGAKVVVIANGALPPNAFDDHFGLALVADNVRVAYSYIVED